jgi:hypothetical protein
MCPHASGALVTLSNTPCAREFTRLPFASAAQKQPARKRVMTQHAEQIARPDVPNPNDEQGRMAHAHLRREWMNAALVDPRREISTPADIAQTSRQVELFARALNNVDGWPDLLVGVVRALTTSAQGVQVLAWCASEHADRHWRARKVQMALQAARAVDEVEE